MKSSILNKKMIKIIPVGGWIYIFYGLLWPISNPILYSIFIIDIILSATHFLQLWVAVPLGNKKGIPLLITVTNTVIFGSTWWKPLKDSLEKQKLL